MLRKLGFSANVAGVMSHHLISGFSVLSDIKSTEESLKKTPDHSDSQIDLWSLRTIFIDEGMKRSVLKKV